MTDDDLIHALGALDAPAFDADFRAGVMARGARRRLVREVLVGLGLLAITVPALAFSGPALGEAGRVLGETLAPVLVAGLVVSGLAWQAYRYLDRGLTRAG
jgi:hypothetical protein